MIDFIKRNKIFAGCFVFCMIIILSLTGILISERIISDEKTNIPPVVDPDPDTPSDPEVMMFTGTFDKASDQIILEWDYRLNEHKLNQVEIYHNKKLIGSFNSEKKMNLSIYTEDISTGSNEFELRLYYDNGNITSRTTTVFIDYIFNVEMNHQLVDNNLGKGYLFTIRYRYNTRTPVGIPKIYINSTFSMGWDAKYIGKTSQPLKEDYLEVCAYYLVSFNEFNTDLVTWNISYSFESVGVRVNDVVSEIITEDDFVKENIEVKK